jgi:hypothetical protein
MKVTVEMTKCDYPGCQEKWDADWTGRVCIICGNDFCDMHASHLHVQFSGCNNLSADLHMNNLCMECSGKLNLAIKEVPGAIRELLEPIVRDCVERLAQKVSEGSRD